MEEQENESVEPEEKEGSEPAEQQEDQAAEPDVEEGSESAKGQEKETPGSNSREAGPQTFTNPRSSQPDDLFSQCRQDESAFSLLLAEIHRYEQLAGTTTEALRRLVELCNKYNRGFDIALDLKLPYCIYVQLIGFMDLATLQEKRLLSEKSLARINNIQVFEALPHGASFSSEPAHPPLDGITRRDRIDTPSLIQQLRKIHKILDEFKLGALEHFFDSGHSLTESPSFLGALVQRVKSSSENLSGFLSLHLNCGRKEWFQSLCSKLDVDPQARSTQLQTPNENQVLREPHPETPNAGANTKGRRNNRKKGGKGKGKGNYSPGAR